MYKDKGSLANLPMQSLMSLRDIMRDDLRRTRQHTKELEETLGHLKEEIGKRGKSGVVDG